ncbi:uncharacterized protein [Clytia hemisphaerica]|uniref:uncharacterized protein n=1 Tax=Clytia hemisphaerica TaxID=252671 RepID=UPI0034D4127F
MPALRDVRNALVLSYAFDMIDDFEFAALYDINRSKNPDFPYWIYEGFDLDKLTDDQSKADFRFFKNDIYMLKEALQIPDTFICRNRLHVDGIEALCILLKRFSYPIRFGDMVPRFGRSEPQLCMITGDITNFVYNMHHQKLSDFNQQWPSPANLQNFANAIHQAGAPLDNCWGFVDGTVRPICRPNQLQRVVYNGHKRVHALKFQSIAAPNGLVANLFGPIEGRRHDSGMLADSNVLPRLRQICRRNNQIPLCIYGDLAYPLRPELQKPFQGLQLTQDQKDYNTAMSKCRIGVEWVFGEITNYFKFMDFKRNLKIGLSPIGKMYIVCTLLTNARTCMYGSQTSSYFRIDPPTVWDYFQ